MSRQRRNFSAKFKSDLVIELLKGEKDLNTLAVENNIQPNLLRNWKKEFLDNASVVFDDKREENLKEKLAEERKEKSRSPSGFVSTNASVVRTSSSVRSPLTSIPADSTAARSCLPKISFPTFPKNAVR